MLMMRCIASLGMMDGEKNIYKLAMIGEMRTRNLECIKLH